MRNFKIIQCFCLLSFLSSTTLPAWAMEGQQAKVGKRKRPDSNGSQSGKRPCLHAEAPAPDEREGTPVLASPPGAMDEEQKPIDAPLPSDSPVVKVFQNQDLMPYILGFCDLENLVRVAGVCKSLRAQVQQGPLPEILGQELLKKPGPLVINELSRYELFAGVPVLKFRKSPIKLGFIAALNFFPNLTSLEFDGNKVPLKEIEGLATSPFLISHLKKLALRDVEIGPRGTSLLGNAIFGNLETLEFSRNKLSARGLETLCKKSVVFSRLRTLNVSHNSLGFKAFNPDVAAFFKLQGVMTAQKFPVLRTLILSNNSLDSSEECKRLAIISSQLPLLEELDLRGNRIKFKDAMEQFVSNPNLSTKSIKLDLRDNDLTSQERKDLRDALLKANATLQIEL